VGDPSEQPSKSPMEEERTRACLSSCSFNHLVSKVGSSQQSLSHKGAATLGRVIWDKIRNPTPYVSEQLKIERWQLREAIHKIKARSNLGAQERVIIYDDGKVTDVDGEHVGNVFDEI
jgi:hypothetical protein